MSAQLLDHQHDACRRVDPGLDTIELRVGSGFGLPVAWVIVNGEPVAGYSHSRSWAKARALAQADAGNRFYMARHLGLSAHPSERPQWRKGWVPL